MQHMKHFSLFVQKNHIYWKTHEKTVNAAARQNVQSTAHGQTALSHKSLEAFDKTSRLADFLCHNVVACFVNGA